MALAAHRVRRQSWRVGVRSAQDAFAARARLRVAVEGALREALERAFDRAAPGAAILHIPRLELRLRVASLDALPEALAEALGRELGMHPPAPPREPQADRLQVLLGYLDSGVLAWHAAHAEAAAAASALRATLREELAPAVRRGPAGAASFERAEQYYFRLLELLPESRWPKAAACIVQAEPALDFTAMRAWLAARAGIPALAAPLAAARAPHEMVAALVAAPAPLPRHEAHRLAAAILAALRMPASFARLLASQAAALAGTPILPRTEVVKGESRAPRTPPLSPTSREERPLTDRSLRDAAAELPQIATVMAGNAGLVLLHPFLPQLFRVCLLVEGDHVVKPHVAAALLHWLATGRDEVFEFELGFVKVLLGLTPQTPLAVGEGLLGAREREEGEALLRAAIAHWKALGNTSVDALRVSFLQRRGALREEEDGWRLQLEPESFDVLLGRLPWAIATVKLPWMTRPLYTDWRTP